jgi:thiamine biosynthesis lipoprotein
LLGTFVEVTADHGEAIDAAFVAIERVHRLMSAHEPDSDVSRINRFAHVEPINVDDWTALVIERALFWSKRSEGAFDVVRAGKSAIERATLPQHPAQPRPLASHWTWLEIQGRCVRLLKAGSIDLGGIAKGFAVDRAIAALAQAGCDRGLVNAGGDLRCFGPGPWPVAIVEPLSRRPVANMAIENGAIATSAGLPDGDGRLSFDHLGGERGWVSVSILARIAMDADALTKIVWAQGTKAIPLLEEADARAVVVTEAGGVEMIGDEALVSA